MQEIRKGLLSGSLIGYFEQVMAVEKESFESRIKMASMLYNLALAIEDEELLKSREKVNSTVIAGLNRILKESDRSKPVGNLVAKFYLERALEYPLQLTHSETVLCNPYYFGLFQKSFATHLLDEASFDNLKLLAKCLHLKENFSFFMKHSGVEFVYSLIISNTVFMDDLIPTKSLLMVADSILFHARGEELKHFFLLLFGKDTQDKIDDLANLLSNIISLTLVYSKLNVNPDLMPVLAQGKLYQVDRASADHALHLEGRPLFGERLALPAGHDDVQIRVLHVQVALRGEAPAGVQEAHRDLPHDLEPAASERHPAVVLRRVLPVPYLEHRAPGLSLPLLPLQRAHGDERRPLREQHLEVLHPAQSHRRLQPRAARLLLRPVVHARKPVQPHIHHPQVPRRSPGEPERNAHQERLLLDALEA